MMKATSGWKTAKQISVDGDAAAAMLNLMPQAEEASRLPLVRPSIDGLQHFPDSQGGDEGSPFAEEPEEEGDQRQASGRARGRRTVGGHEREMWESLQPFLDNLQVISDWWGMRAVDEVPKIPQNTW